MNGVLAHRTPLAGAAVAGLSGLLFARALDTRTNYDEGVYLASLDALRHGQELGKDLYAVQPPGFYALLRVLGAPFGHSVEGIRLAFVLVAVIGVVGAFVAGWRLFGTAAGLAAAAMVAIGPPFPTVAPTVSADVPSIAFGLLALGLIAVAVGRSSRGWAVAAGAAFGFAVLVKFLVLPFAVPFLALVVSARAGRRLLPVAVVGGAAVAAFLLLINLGSLHELWQGVVIDHRSAQAGHDVSDNVHRIRTLLHPHTPFAWLVPAGLVAFLLSREARRTWPLATVVPTAAAFTVYQRPLNDHHLVLMSSAYAIAAGPALALGLAQLPGRWRTAAAAATCLFVAAGLYQEQRRLARNDVPEPPEVSWATGVVDADTSTSQLVASDLPVVNFLAGRRLPGFLSDTSNTRISSGILTPRRILVEIDRSRAGAVVAGRMFRTLPGLLSGLDRRYPVRLRCGTATLYLVREPGPGAPPCPL